MYLIIVLTTCLVKVYFFTDDYYTSDAKIIPAVSGSKSGSKLTGLASQFGVSLPPLRLVAHLRYLVFFIRNN